MSTTLHKILIGWFFAGILVGSVCFDARLARLGDNAEFIVISNSIVTGQGISYVHSLTVEPARKFPPGYPVILAGVQWLSPSNIYAMKSVTVFFFGLLIPLAWLVIREVDTTGIATGVTIASLLSPQLVDYSHQVLSEIPYAAVSFAALFALLRLRESTNTTHLAALVLLAVSSYYLRTIGLTVIGATFLTFLLARRYKEALILGGGAGLLALPWFIASTTYLSQVSSANPYFREDGGATIAGLVDRIWTNISLYGSQFLPNGLVPFYDFRIAEGALPTALAVLSSLLFVYFVIRIARPSHPAFPVAIYLVLYCGILILWPDVWTDTRFIVPIIPFGLYGLLWGVRDLADRIPISKDARQKVWFAAAALIILANGSRTASTQVDPAPFHIAWSDYYRSAAWIATNTPADAVIACRKPFLMHVVSGRRTMAFPFIDPRPLTQALKDAGVDYVVTDVIFNQTVDYLNPAVVQHPATFHPVNKFPASNTMVFELLSDEGGRDPLAEKRKELESVLARNPGDRTVWRQLMSIGVSYHQRNDLDKAIEIYEPVSQSLRESDVFHNLGIAYYARSRFAESAAAFLEAVRLDGSDASARLGLAQAYANAGDYENGYKHGLEAMRLDPRSAVAAQTMARCAMSLNRWEDAETGLRQALRLEPGTVTHKARLSEVLINTGRHEEAQAILEGILEERPELLVARLRLIQAQTQLGRTESALRHLKCVAQNHTDRLKEPLPGATRRILEGLAEAVGSTVEEIVERAQPED